MHIIAIVVAAGRGTRMGVAAPKAFLPLNGKPLVAYSLRTLSAVPSLDSIVLVVPDASMDTARALVADQGPWRAEIRLTLGGAERQDSVAAGLAAADGAADLVVIHDAARPFVSLALIQACIDAAASDGAAIAAVPASDTVKVATSDGAVARTLDRREIWLAQTPQVFRLALLRRAYAAAQQDHWQTTDDAAMVERLGATVRLVPGETANRKITTPEDLEWAERYLQAGDVRW